MSILTDFFYLFYPNQCLSCGNSLDHHNQKVCIHCMSQLSFTQFSEQSPNPVEQLFWGKVSIEHATALFHFSKNSCIQQLIHQLKYNRQKNIGFILGKMLGNDLLESPFFKDLDFLVPVPIHPSKKIKRGYNQSEEIAKGIYAQTGLEIETKLIYKNSQAHTQTQKKRFERWENVKETFSIHSLKELEGKHILLIDDVITTGSTLVACIEKLNEIKDLKISVAALAYSE